MKSAEENEKHKVPRKWVGCELESAYFGDERKHGRAERKLASAKDRSKYKKTDQRKQANQEQKDLVETDDLKKGRVLSIASQGIIVEANGDMLSCTLRGALKKDKTLLKNLVVVGDFVLFSQSDQKEGLIVQVEPRRTVLSRADNLSRRKEQLIAANIDQVIITASVVSPELKPSLIDRYIIATQKGGMEPIIVVNKIDLLTAPDQDPIVQEADKEMFEELMKAYKAVHIPVIPVSVQTGEGMDALRQAMKGKSSVFSGQSGVGKSSLINTITGKSLRIGDMVGKTNKGSHTTTTAQLIPLDSGGWCIDTPGIKSFGVWNLDKDEVKCYFPEISAYGHKCHFPDCSHHHETGCAVIEAVERGDISWLRYESYLMLKQSVAEDHCRR
ncbi:MAG: ribosome small subunit-dependent GTPase A [Parachlamydiaceae bacterium]